MWELPQGHQRLHLDVGASLGPVGTCTWTWEPPWAHWHPHLDIEPPRSRQRPLRCTRPYLNGDPEKHHQGASGPSGCQDPALPASLRGRTAAVQSHRLRPRGMSPPLFLMEGSTWGRDAKQLLGVAGPLEAFSAPWDTAGRPGGGLLRVWELACAWATEAVDSA